MLCVLVSIGAQDMREIIPFPVLLIPFPVLKISFGLELCQAQVWLGVEVELMSR